MIHACTIAGRIKAIERERYIPMIKIKGELKKLRKLK